MPQGCGSVLSLDSRAGSGITLTTTAGSRPRGTTRQASPDSRVRCATLSVCVIWQWGVSVIVEQLALAPVATLPVKLPTANGVDDGRARAEMPRPGLREIDGDGQAHAAIERGANLLPADVEFGDHVYFGRSMTVPQLRQVRCAGDAEEAVEHRRQLGFDVRDFDELLVQLRAAVLAVPLEAIELAGAARALDDQAHGVGGAARRVRHVRRQQEDLAFADRRCPRVCRPAWWRA